MDQVQLIALELPQVPFALASKIRNQLWKMTGNASFRMLLPLIPLVWTDSSNRFAKNCHLPKPGLPLVFDSVASLHNGIWMLLPGKPGNENTISSLKQALQTIFPATNPASVAPPWYPSGGIDGIWLGIANAQESPDSPGMPPLAAPVHAKDLRATGVDHRGNISITDAHCILLDIQGDWVTHLSYQITDRIHLA